MMRLYVYPATGFNFKTIWQMSIKFGTGGLH